MLRHAPDDEQEARQRTAPDAVRDGATRIPSHRPQVLANRQPYLGGSNDARFTDPYPPSGSGHLNWGRSLAASLLTASRKYSVSVAMACPAASRLSMDWRSLVKV